MQVRPFVKIIFAAAALASAFTLPGCQNSAGKAQQAGPPEVAVVEIRPQRVALSGLVHPSGLSRRPQYRQASLLRRA